MQYFKNNYTTLFKKYNNLDDCDKNYTFTILNNLLEYLYEMNIFWKTDLDRLSTLLFTVL